jgi:hypothetical protein
MNPDRIDSVCADPPPPEPPEPPGDIYDELAIEESGPWTGSTDRVEPFQEPRPQGTFSRGPSAKAHLESRGQYRVVPHDIAAEQAVLGSILIDRDAIVEVADVLGPDDFYRQGHALIFGAMRTLHRAGQPVDVVTVAAELDRTGNREAAGGASYLSLLGNETPTAVHVIQYARIVADAAVRRNLAEGALKLYEAASNHGTEDELADRVVALNALATGRWAVELVPGWRTLAEIPDEAPEPLLFGMCEPHGPTLPYAAPGVGKGMTGAYLVREAQALGMKAAIFDAEQREREWARRCSGLGVDRTGVVYITPHDLGARNAGRPLWESAPVLGAILHGAGADLLLVDSILPACAVGEERLRADAAVPFMFVAALDALGLPSVSFGHTPKGSPEGDPFGSFAWVASSRLTWLGTRAEGDRHAVRWRPRKRNERGHIPGLLLTFEYDEAGRLCGVTREDDEEVTRDWVLAALVHGPRSVADLAEDLLAETDDGSPGAAERIKERLSQALRRMKKDGWVLRNGVSGPRVTWDLNPAGGH